MTPWQTAIDALRSQEWTDSPLLRHPPTVACVERALAWMEARAMTDPIRWPSQIATLTEGGLDIGFGIGSDLYLSAEFRNDGTAEWIEYRDGKIIARGQIPCTASIRPGRRNEAGCASLINAVGEGS